MTETGLSGKLMKTAHTELRGCKVIKHADRATRGVPDITISWTGFTNWIENKLVRKGCTLKDVCNLQQLIFCHELEVTTGGRCWVSVYEEAPQRITIWSPRVLALEIWPKLNVDPPRRPPEVIAWDEPVNLYEVFRASGSVRCSGWDHRFITKMVKDSTRARA